MPDRMRSLALMLVIGGFSVFGSASGEEMLYGEFSASVTVTAEGQLVLRELAGVKEPVDGIVRARLQEQVYLPAVTGEGVPVDRDAYITGQVVLVPAGADDLDVEIRDVAMRSALPVSTPAPRYPSREFQRRAAGHVEVTIQVAADGTVAGVGTVSTASREFEKAVRDALAEWTFETPARPVALTMPFWFHRDGARPARPPEFSCAVPEGEPRLQGQAGCEDTVNIILTRMKVVDGVVR